MNLAKILKQRRDAERRLELTSPVPVFNGGAADSVEGGGNEIISDGVTLAQLTAGLAGKSNTDHVHEFIDLTDAPSAYTGAGGKIVAVNSGATALEFISAPAAANGVPEGGTTNQLAAKNSDTDFDLKLVDAPNAANGIPTGGTTEQILSKVDGTDYNAHWVDKPSGGSSPLTTKGDVYVYGSADARLPVGTDGQVLTADSAQTLGVKWAAASGGGSGWTETALISPTNPSIYNDEFDDNTLDSSWIKVFPAGKEPTYTEKNGILSILGQPNSGFNLSALMKSFTGLTPPVTIEIAFRIANPNQSFGEVGLIFADGATFGAGTQVIALQLFTNVPSYHYFIYESGYSTRTNYDTTPAMGAMVSPFCYFRMTWVSTNTWRMEISPDGITWIKIMPDFTRTLTPTHFGFCAQGAESATKDIVASIEYFRVY